jgi:hypothetical protein
MSKKYAINSDQDGLNGEGSSLLDTQDTIDPSEDEDYKFAVTPYRWVIVVLFTMNFLG